MEQKLALLRFQPVFHTPEVSSGHFGAAGSTDLGRQAGSFLSANKIATGLQRFLKGSTSLELSNFHSHLALQLDCARPCH